MPFLIEVARKAGHCFGVKAAIQKAFETARAAQVPVFTLGPIIHNPQVVQELEKEGVKAVKNLSEVAQGVIIIRSHGVPPSVIAEARERGLTVVNATCPFVTRAQTLAKKLVDEGYELVLLGDAAHPEVEGILGTVEGAARVVSEAAEAQGLPERKRYGLIAQTTQSLDRLQSVACALLTRTHELKVFNTICNATTDLQAETQALAKRVGLLFVVGGRNSANTARLAELGRGAGVATRHIETAGEIDPAWLAGLARVGVTAGTSTPDWIIASILDRLRELDGRVAE